MNILIGINHPKQVYMFKNIYKQLIMVGHSCSVIVVDKEISSTLLYEFDIPFYLIGKSQKSKIFKFLSLIPLTIKTIIFAKKRKIDLFLGQALVHLAWASFLLNKKFIIFEDTENAIIPQLLANPFANTIITPESFKKDFGSKQIRIKGSFELSYLRYNWFKPDIDVLSSLGLGKDEVFIIIRFVSWNANHDIGHNGISLNNKILLVKEFSKYGKVFISSEADLPHELEANRIRINVSKMHSLLYYAKLVYGESASMAAEAAYLGTPSIFVNDQELGYINKQVEYNLIYPFAETLNSQIDSINKGEEILLSKDDKYWKTQAKKITNECIDVSAFLIWFIENYPHSHKIMKKNPEYQERFR